MAILVISTIVHFYTVAHLTAVTALKQMDPEFESVGASLKAPFYPHLLAGDGVPGVPARHPRHHDLPLRERDDHGVRGGIHLRPTRTWRRSRSSTWTTPATSRQPRPWGMMIFYTAASVRLVHFLVSRYLQRRTQAWRVR